MQSVPITTNIVSSNPTRTRCIRYNIMWLAVSSSTIKTDRHDTTEMLLKVALNTITLTLCIGVWSCYFKLLIISFNICCGLTYFLTVFAAHINAICGNAQVKGEKLYTQLKSYLHFKFRRTEMKQLTPTLSL